MSLESRVAVLEVKDAASKTINQLPEIVNPIDSFYVPASTNGVSAGKINISKVIGDSISDSNQYTDQKINTLEYNKFSGSYNASFNTPELNDSTGIKNHEYSIINAGANGTMKDFGSGAMLLKNGDVIMHNGTVWFKKIDNNQSLDESDVGSGLQIKNDKILVGGKLEEFWSLNMNSQPISFFNGQNSGGFAVGSTSRLQGNKTEIRSKGEGGIKVVAENDISNIEFRVETLGALNIGNKYTFLNLLKQYAEYDSEPDYSDGNLLAIPHIGKVLSLVEESRLDNYTEIEVTEQIYRLSSFANNSQFRLTYSGKGDINFKFNDAPTSNKKVRHAVVYVASNKKIYFTSSSDLTLIVPPGKLPSATGVGCVVTVYSITSADGAKYIFLSGDLDSMSIDEAYSGPVAINGGATQLIFKNGLLVDIEQFS